LILPSANTADYGQAPGWQSSGKFQIFVPAVEFSDNPEKLEIPGLLRIFAHGGMSMAREPRPGPRISAARRASAAMHFTGMRVTDTAAAFHAPHHIIYM
jgi:hypothetical protein